MTARIPIAKRLLSNSGWLYGSEGIALLLRLGSGIAIARTLGVAQFGRFALIVAVVTFISQVVDFRAWETAIRFVIKYSGEGQRDKARAVLKLCYLLDTSAAVLAWVLAMLLAPLAARIVIGDPAMAPLVRVYACCLLFGAPAATAAAMLRAADLFRLSAIRSLASSGIRTATLVCAAAAGASLKTLVLLHVPLAFIDLVIAASLSLFATAKLELARWWSTSLETLRDERRRLTSFLGFTNLAALLKVLQTHLDLLLVGCFLSSVTAGYVQLGRSFTDAMRFLAVPGYMAAYPEYARAWDLQDAQAVRRVTSALVKITSAIAMAALVFMLLVAEPAVLHLSGRAYLPAVPLIRLLAIGTAMEIPSALLHPLLTAGEKTSWSMIALAISIGVRVTTLLVLLPSQQELAPGLAHVTYACTYVALMTFAAHRAVRDLSSRSAA